MFKTFSKLDNFTKGFLIVAFIFSIATPFIINNKQLFLSQAASPYVTASGTQLTINGEAYRFLGVNRYNLLTLGSYPYRGCGDYWSDLQLDQWFSETRGMGANAVRLWAFQLFTYDTNTSQFDYSRLDYLLNTLAPKNNIKLILVLENQWQDCTQGGYKYDAWYQSGYLYPYGKYKYSFKDYVQKIVTRYKDNASILMWQILNEAEDKLPNGSCASGTNLYNFTLDISKTIKAIDSNHLVSLGTLGAGQCGTSGSMYTNLHSISGIDVVEAHDYNRETESLPQAIADDLQVAKSLNKPFFVGEAGIKSNCIEINCYSQDQRASYFNAKMNSLFTNGGIGYLIWIYRNPLDNSEPFVFTNIDPLYQVIKSVASALTPASTGFITLTPTVILSPTNTPTPIPTTITLDNITATNIKSTKTTITWTTSFPATSMVEYWTLTSSHFFTALDSALMTSHSVILSGLTPRTFYNYKVHSRSSLQGVDFVAPAGSFKSSR